MMSTPPKGVELCLQPSTIDMMAMEETSTFQFTPGQRFEVTSKIQKSFDRDGYIVIRLPKPIEKGNIQLWNIKFLIPLQISDTKGRVI